MATKIDKKITGYSVVEPSLPANDSPSAPPATPAPVLLVHSRPEVVEGRTYKIRPPIGSSAFYITVNDIIEADGKRRPIEVFINTKDTTHFQWVTALTRVVSALFRKPGEFLFILDELQQVYDPQGGYWDKGEMIPSVVAHIGKVLKEHCRHLGLIEAPVLSDAAIELVTEKKAIAEAKGIKGTLCAKCGEMSVVLIDNCSTCLSCSDSRCG